MHRLIQAVTCPRRLRTLAAFALTFLALLCPAPEAGAAGMLLEVRHGVQPEYTRIVLDMSARTDYTHRLELNPPRVVLEIPGGTVAKGLSPRRIRSALVAGVRVDRLRGPSTLVVIDLAQLCAYRTFALDAGRGTGSRIVVDLFAGDSAPAPAAEDSLPEVGGSLAPPPVTAPRDEAAGPPMDDASGVGEAIPAPPETLYAAPAQGSELAVTGADQSIEEFVPSEALRVRAGRRRRRAGVPEATPGLGGDGGPRRQSAGAAAPESSTDGVRRRPPRPAAFEPEADRGDRCRTRRARHRRPPRHDR